MEGSARPYLLLKPADLRNLWYLPTGFLTLLKTHKVVGISLAPPVAKLLTLLGKSIVVETRDITSARTLVQL